MTPFITATPNSATKPTAEATLSGDTGDVQRDQSAERCQRHHTEDQRHLAQRAEFGKQQHDHQAEDQPEDQDEPRLSALLAFEVAAPFEAVEARIELDLLGDGLLRLRQQSRQAAAVGIELHQEVAVVHVAVDGAFAGLQLDAARPATTAPARPSSR